MIENSPEEKKETMAQQVQFLVTLVQLGDKFSKQYYQKLDALIEDIFSAEDVILKSGESSVPKIMVGAPRRMRNDIQTWVNDIAKKYNINLEAFNHSFSEEEEEYKDFPKEITEKGIPREILSKLEVSLDILYEIKSVLKSLESK